LAIWQWQEIINKSDIIREKTKNKMNNNLNKIKDKKITQSQNILVNTSFKYKMISNFKLRRK